MQQVRARDLRRPLLTHSLSFDPTGPPTPRHPNSHHHTRLTRTPRTLPRTRETTRRLAQENFERILASVPVTGTRDAEVQALLKDEAGLFFFFDFIPPLELHFLSVIIVLPFTQSLSTLKVAGLLRIAGTINDRDWIFTLLNTHTHKSHSITNHTTRVMFQSMYFISSLYIPRLQKVTM